MNKFFKIFLVLIFTINNVLALNNIDKSSYINTQNITYNELNQTIELGKNSLINLNETNILINQGVIDYQNERVDIIGKFYLYQDLNILKGEGLEGNLKLTQFTAKNASYIYNDDLKIDSKKIKRDENNIYFYNNFLTPCVIDGYFNCPTWSIKVPKTKYIIDKDKFIHFNSFFQIADHKLFYLPYFTHYGTKAPRQKGFLIPTLEFDLLGNGISIKTPYYFPIKNSSDITITPKFNIDNDNLNLSENIELKTIFNKKLSGGNLNLNIDTFRNNNVSNFYNTIKLETNQNLDKNNTLELIHTYTNSVSATRSINEKQIPFDNSFVRLKSYNLLKNDDILVSEINTVTAYDNSDNSLVPYQLPSIKYLNNYNLSKNTNLFNRLEIGNIRRNSSNNINPSESNNYILINEIFNQNIVKNLFITNKIIFNNSYKELKYNFDPSINQNYKKNNLSISSDIKFNNNLLINPRVKMIYNHDYNSNKGININEDSHALSFNYNNLFSENRFFGNDLYENSKRIVFGIESIGLLNNKLKFKIGQSYDTNLNNNYLNEIKQKDKQSDIALNAKLDFRNILIDLNSRLDKNNLSKKEIGYSIHFDKPIILDVDYIETSSDAFLKNSDDSKSLNLNAGHQINNNILFSTFTNIDLKNNFSPYESGMSLIINDECSELTINYLKSNFSDDFNTVPKETVSLSFKMDYLGFFGYEQETDLFFTKPGNINYGN